MMVAFIRTSEWEWPLFLHVLGAMILVGGMFVASLSLLLAWRAQSDGDAAALTRFAYRMLLFVVLPAFIAMRIGAQWVLHKSPWKGTDPNWVKIGGGAADILGVALIVALVLAGIGLRRADNGRGGTGARVVTVVTLLLLAAYIVAIWAMTTKPT
jgi:hypothetical protein